MANAIKQVINEVAEKGMQIHYQLYCSRYCYN